MPGAAEEVVLAALGQVHRIAGFVGVVVAFLAQFTQVLDADGQTFARADVAAGRGHCRQGRGNGHADILRKKAFFY